MFHPAAGRSAREAAGDSASAMSISPRAAASVSSWRRCSPRPALVALGVGATALFIPPALLIGLRCSACANTQRDGPRRQPGRARPAARSWRPFRRSPAVEVVRSVAVLRGEHVHRAVLAPLICTRARGLAGAALACFLVGGVAGTLLGGRIADRSARSGTVRLGTRAAIPPWSRCARARRGYPPLAAGAGGGLALNIPFAVLVKLGQDYLPTRPGTAAGVTLGLGVSSAAWSRRHWARSPGPGERRPCSPSCASSPCRACFSPPSYRIPGVRTGLGGPPGT